MHPNGNAELRLESYGAGYALLRPEQSRIAERFVLPLRYVMTDQGRRALAMALLFDQGPTVAEVRNRS